MDWLRPVIDAQIHAPMAGPLMSSAWCYQTLLMTNLIWVKHEQRFQCECQLKICDIIWAAWVPATLMLFSVRFNIWPRQGTCAITSIGNWMRRRPSCFALDLWSISRTFQFELLTNNYLTALHDGKSKLLFTTYFKIFLFSRANKTRSQDNICTESCTTAQTNVKGMLYSLLKLPALAW